MKIAVLLACYNRREKTLACLKNLTEQELPAGASLEIFLTDDNSSDGTAEAVQRQFPFVRVFEGTGSLFWAGGMRYTWKKALEVAPDYYLLLNDDTYLLPDAVKRLLECNLSFTEEHSISAICVGRTKDPDTGEVSYGGRKQYAPRRLQSYLVPDSDEIVECDMGEANIMLVPKKIVGSIGILSESFTHGFADIDYTLEARKAGFKVIIPPGFLGVCKNDHGKSWKSSGTKLSERLRYMYSPKGLAYKEYLYFVRRHFPAQTVSAFTKLWVKTLFPIIYDKFRKES